MAPDRVQMGTSPARKQGKALSRPKVEIDPLQVAGLASVLRSALSSPFPKTPQHSRQRVGFRNSVRRLQQRQLGDRRRLPPKELLWRTRSRSFQVIFFPSSIASEKYLLGIQRLD
jgi:hypothetical protein